MTAGANAKFVICTRSVCAGTLEAAAGASVAGPPPTGIPMAPPDEPPQADISRTTAASPPAKARVVRFPVISLLPGTAEHSSRALGGPSNSVDGPVVSFGQQGVPQDEGGHVVAELQTHLVVDPCVDAGVDPTETRLLLRGAETHERARHARQRRGRDREPLVVAE